MDNHDLIGRRVANDGSELKKALEEHYQIKSLKHIGSFVFRAELADGTALHVYTEPVGLKMQKIRITEIHEAVLRRRI